MSESLETTSSGSRFAEQEPGHIALKERGADGAGKEAPSPWQDPERGVGLLVLARVAARDATCAAARLVCRRWAELAGAARQQLSPSGGTPCREVPGGWAQAFPELRYLDLSALPDYRPAAGCVARLRRLRSLHMPLMGRSGGSTWLAEAAPQLPALTALDLSFSTCLWDPCLEALQPLTGLRTLALNSTLVGGEEGMVALAALTSLTNLELSACRGLTDKGAACIGALADLRTLDLSRCDVGDAGLTAIARGCQRLTHLSLHGSQRLTGRGLAALAACTDLRSLEAPGCPALTDDGVQALAGAHVRSLRTLNLGRFRDSAAPTFAQDHCALLTDEALAAAARIPSLTALDLEGNGSFTDAGVTHLGALRGLTQLYMSNCTRVTDDGLAAMLEPLTALREIHIAGFSSLTDSGIVSLQASATNLRTVVLNCCRRLTDGMVQHLLLMPELRSVHLHGCHNVSPAAVEELRDHNVDVLWYAMPNEWVEYQQ